LHGATVRSLPRVVTEASAVRPFEGFDGGDEARLQTGEIALERAFVLHRVSG